MDRKQEDALLKLLPDEAWTAIMAEASLSTAVLVVRQKTGLGLKEAVEAVEAARVALGLSKYPWRI